MIELSTKVISPTMLTDAMFVSSTAPENEYAAWSPDTTYPKGQKCIRNHKIYERLIDGKTAAAPEDDKTNWLDADIPTNQRAMFDDVVGTQTSVASPLTVVLKPGSISGLGLLELVGRSVSVTLTTATGGATAFSRTIDLDGTIIDSVYDWFYQPFVQRSSVVLTDLPFHFPNGELTITVTATVGNAAIGVCKFGEVIGIGSSEYGATSGITSYGVKSTDEFGRTSFKKRGFSKKMSLKVLTNKSDYERISRDLANLRDTPAVWVATEADGFGPLTVFGPYKDFLIDVTYPTAHYCSLEIEGLI